MILDASRSRNEEECPGDVVGTIGRDSRCASAALRRAGQMDAVPLAFAFQDGKRDVVDGDAVRRPSLGRATVRVPVEDDIGVVRLDRGEEAGGAEERVDL